MDLTAYRVLDPRLLDWADAAFENVPRDDILPTIQLNLQRFQDNCDDWRAWATTAAPMRTAADLVAQYPATDWVHWVLIDGRILRDVNRALADLPGFPAAQRLKAASADMLARIEAAARDRLLALGVGMDDMGILPDGTWHLAFYLLEN